MDNESQQMFYDDCCDASVVYTYHLSSIETSSIMQQFTNNKLKLFIV